MSNLLDRLRKRIYPNPVLFTAAVGVNGCAAVPATMQAYPQTFTIGGPDLDMQDAILRIVALEALIAPARELLTLYDWRPELAKAEKDPTVDPKWLKKQLREYGERKKAGWIALRAALDSLT